MPFPISVITPIVVLALGLIAWSAFLVGLGGRPRHGVLVAVAFTAWLAVCAWLGHHDVVLGPSSPPFLVAVPLGIAVAVGVLALRAPRFRAFVTRVPTALWVAPHVMRVVGLHFVVLAELGYLPMGFAAPAGYGDAVAGILAVPVLLMLVGRHRFALPALVAWNVVGLLDFASAFVAGPTQIPPFLAEHALPYAMRYFVLIPIFVVPIYVLTHVYSLVHVFWPAEQD